MPHKDQISVTVGTPMSSGPKATPGAVGPQGNFNPEELFTSKQLANYLKVSERLPESWRLQGSGPSYIRVGGKRGRVVYRWADIVHYLQERSFSSTSEEPSRVA